MKNTLLLTFLAAFIFTTEAFSQLKVSVSLGTEEEMLDGLSAEYIASTANLDMSGIDMSQFSKSTMYSMYCENPYVRAGITAAIPKSKLEVYAGAVGIFNRWDDITYRYSDQNGEYSYMNFSSTSNELGIESYLNRHMTIGSFLYFDAGVGANLGYSFGGYAHASYRGPEEVETVRGRNLNQIISGNDIAFDEVVVVENAHDYASLNNGVHVRVMGKLGAGLILFQKFDIGIQSRFGLGTRRISGAETTGTRIFGTDVSVGYIF